MEELLRELISQNAELIQLMTDMADKLDKLDDISSSLTSIDNELFSLSQGQIDIKYSVQSIADDLQWHKEHSFASQLIRAVEGSGT